MTHLVARLILTMLILPIAGAVFVLCFVGYTVLFSANTVPPATPLIGLWAIVYLVIAFSWIMIWRPVVRWTRRRVAQTVVSAVVALAAGAAFGFTIWAFTRVNGAPVFISVLLGGGVPPIVWVLSTVLTWRETAGERTERLAGRPNGAEPVVCPMCGYDMSGAPTARCPECGVAFSIGELVAAQPERALRTLDDE